MNIDIYIYIEQYRTLKNKFGFKLLILRTYDFLCNYRTSNHMFDNIINIMYQKYRAVLVSVTKASMQSHYWLPKESMLILDIKKPKIIKT